jgi:potassium inwardly-rectifying channel subfamily J
MAHAAGSADIYTTEYMENDLIPQAIERTCSPMCGEREETKPLITDERDTKQLGHGQYPRLLSRAGETNVVHYDKRSRKILTQMGFMFHVLIGMRAWKLVVLFFVSYIASYFIIGGIMWCSHDVSEFHGIHNYWEAVVFTGYTMTTVGFGNQYPTHPQSAIMPLFAVVFSLLMDAFWLGVIFARIATPRPLRHTILFSKHAVLYKHQQSCYTFSCRAVNLRVRYPWVDLNTKMTLSLYDHSTQSIQMHDLKISSDSSPFLDIPCELQHEITNDSPLLRFINNESNFDEERGEILVELNGQDPLTGNCMKKRFSYIADEIVRDFRFAGVLSDATQDRGYGVDLTKFHEIEPQPIYGSAGTIKNEQLESKITIPASALKQ